MRLHSNNKNIKIAICIPCRETVHSLFSYNLVQMTQWCNLAGYKVFVLMESGSLISRQRQNLTKAAIDQGASHILWLDSDMMFPADIIDSMLRHNLDIVACNYSTRTVPFKGVAYTKIGDWNSWLRPYTGQGKKLRAVEGVGMGCMLVNVDVFKNMPKPWYEVKYSEKYNDFIGEDFYFCENARQLGYKIIIDTELSNHLKHLGLVGMEMQNTLP